MIGCHFSQFHARIQKVLSDGVQLRQRFLEGREDLNEYHYTWATIDPPAKRHLNGASLVCRLWPKIECWLGSFVTFQGVGGGPDPCPPSGSAHEFSQYDELPVHKTGNYRIPRVAHIQSRLRKRAFAASTKICLCQKSKPSDTLIQ